MAQCVQNKHATCPHGNGDGLTQSWRHTGQDLSDARGSGVVNARRVDIVSFVGLGWGGRRKSRDVWGWLVGVGWLVKTVEAA
jgi:hypothetical protein